MKSKSVVASLILVFVLAVGLTGLNCSSRDTTTRSRGGMPNVVLLIIDALRADLLGCYGFPAKTSPEIDQMAQSGVVFENVISQCSWTRPSIASMVTSLYPRTLGMYKEQYDILADRHLTLAEILQANGYNTLGITANPHLNKVFNFHQGFDSYVETEMTWGEMKAREEKRARKSGLGIQLPKCQEVYRRVLRIAESMGENPTYIQINIMEVHSPVLVRNRFKHKFGNYPVQLRDGYPPKTRARLKHLVRRTLAAVGQVSFDTEAFVDSLLSTPGWDNTLFVITSDHGQGLIDHPDVDQSTLHGNLLYESQVNVPLILYNPADSVALCGGRRVKERVRLLDIVPTILDYVGIPPPEGLQGESVLALATGVGEPPTLPPIFVTETGWRTIDKQAAYGQEWKYIENRDDWGGVNPFELQRVGVKENGKLTDEIAAFADEAARLREFLRWWEEEHPRVESTQPVEDPSEEELEQLRSLGYIK